ncbi:MAG TPA: DUF1801 domain-containing protein [Chitinophagaceae bacterium]|nr:DUF1801 domain-containing protein [Chitinophagaceae bacterium]
MKRIAVKNVDEYIYPFPLPISRLPEKLRNSIKTDAPKAEEVICCRFAGYKYHGMLIYFAGFKNHLNIYMAPGNTGVFKKELAAFKGGKGTVHFPTENPLPIDMVKRIVKFRMKANEVKNLYIRNNPQPDFSNE